MALGRKAALALSASALGICTLASGAQAQVIIDNGTVQLGVNPAGQLIVGSTVGLTFLPSVDAGISGEALAPGCDCEGWGVADLTAGTFGEAGQSFGIRNVFDAAVVASGAGTRVNSVGSAAVSTARVTNGATSLLLEHNYTPSTATPYLYRVDVSIQNIADTAVDNLVYRRAMDWDIPPLEFSEYVTLQGWPATNLIGSSDDGFVNGNPNVPLSTLASDAVLNGNFSNSGPDDHGAAFDFSFGTLAVGDTQVFQIFYGAAPSEADALNALAAVSAEVYSLGKVGDAAGRDAGTPHTFIFGFAGVGGTPVAPGASGASINVLPELSGVLLAANRALVSGRLAPFAAGRLLGVRLDTLDPGESLGEWTFHLHGFAGTGRYDPTTNNAGYSFSTRGMAVALDRMLAVDFGMFDTAVLGAQLGLMRSTATLENGAGDARATGTELMLYGQAAGGTGYFAEGTLHVGHLSYSQRRVGLTTSFNSDPSGRELGAMVRFGRSFKVSPFEGHASSLGGYVELAADHTRVNGYTEDNGGLTVGDYSNTRQTAGVGMRFDTILDQGEQTVVAGLDVAALYVRGGEFDALQTTVGGSTATRLADERDGPALRVGASVTAIQGSNWAAKFQIDGMVSRELKRSYGASAEWRMRF
jgi:hypothetical protein